jgi:hypothetical protein
MWMLSFIPDAWFTYAVHGIFIFGLVGYVAGAFASKLPFISTYGGIVKIIGGLFLIAGLLLEVYSYGTSSYRKAAEDYRKQVEVAEEKANNWQISRIDGSHNYKRNMFVQMDLYM